MSNYAYMVIYIYIYAQRLGFAQASQRRGSPFPIKCCCNSVCISLGRSTKVLGNIKMPSQLNFTFIEDLQ